MLTKVKLLTIIRTMLLLLFSMCIFSSCNKYVLYSHTATDNQQKQGTASTSTDEPLEKLLQPNDKISISIWGHEDLSVGSVHNIYNVQEETGKWLMIDSKGEVNLPQIGMTKLEGLTLLEAKKVLENAYGKFIVDPIINLRILNNEVTIIGEVQRAGIYIYSTDNIRLVDLIAKASGFTDYAKTTKIKIIRGKESFVIDMTNTSLSDTRVYPNDVVYIPPSGGKKFDRFSAKLIPLASLITAIALVYSVSKK